MKCSKCSAEVPGQSRYCLRCGNPIPVAYHGNPANAFAPVTSPASTARRSLLLGIIAALAAAAIGLFVVLRASNPTTSASTVPNTRPLVDASRLVPNAGPLTDRTSAITPLAPITDHAGITASSPPADVVDYLAFLKEMERQRLLLGKRLVAAVLPLGAQMQFAGSDSAALTGDPEPSANKSFGEFARTMSQCSADYQTLAQKFMQKSAPTSCRSLQSSYYSLLGDQASVCLQTGNAFQSAMAPDPATGAPANVSKGLQALVEANGSGPGSLSYKVGEACTTADGALAKVCDEYRIHKDFDILDDGGGANLLGH